MQSKHWKLAAWLLLAGGVTFWAGAFTPPYKQWMTSDIAEYLGVIGQHRVNWYFINGSFVLGVLTTVFGVHVLNAWIQHQQASLAASIGWLSFTFGAVFWIINLGFRLTVTVWAAADFQESGSVVPIFQSLHQWTGALFAVYMVLAYFGTGWLGVAVRETNAVPVWLSRGMIVFGFAGSLLYLVRFPLFDPPLMVHLPFIVLGIFMLTRSNP